MTSSRYGLLAVCIACCGCSTDGDTGYRHLSEDDIMHASYMAAVDKRISPTENNDTYPLFTGGIYYEKGLNIPIRDSITLAVDKNHNYAVFSVGADMFNYPDAEMRCRLVVKGNGEKIYESDEITYGSRMQDIVLDISDIDSLQFKVEETDCRLFNSSDNWADVYNFSLDIVNFVWSDSRRVKIDERLQSEAEDISIGAEITRISLPASAWTVRYIPEQEIILAGCFDNKVYALDRAGDIKWSVELEGVPHNIACSYENGRLGICIFSWSNHTSLTFVDNDGKIINTVDNDCKIDALTAYKDRFCAIDERYFLKEYSHDGRFLAMHRLAGIRRNPVVLKYTEALTGKPDILVGSINNLYCYNSDYRLKWQRLINPSNTFLSATHGIEETVIDGDVYLAVGSRPGAVSVLDSIGNIVWKDRYVGRGHSAPEIAVGNFTGRDRQEIAGVSPDGYFHLYSSDGLRLRRFGKQMPFVDIETMRGDRCDKIVAASTGPRDKNIYIIGFTDSGKIKGSENIRNFREDHVTPVMEEMKGQIKGLEFRKENTKEINVAFLFDPFGGNFVNPSAFYSRDVLPEAVERCRKLKEMTDSLSGNHVHFIPMIDLWSCVFHKERRDIIDDSLNLQLLSEMEKMGLDFAIFVMHGNYIPSDIIRKIAEQNKNTLKAFHFSERKGMEDYKREVMTIARENGQKVLFGIHQDHWLNVTQDKKEFNALFAPEFKDVIVPVVKPNPSSFDLNLMSIIGLWSKGYMSEWGVASQHWNWNWITRNIDDLFPADLLFRHDFIAASMGATWYLPEGDFEQGLELTQFYHQGREPFYDLLKSGIFCFGPPKQNARISDISIQYKKKPNFVFTRDNRPGDFFTTGFYEGLLMTTPENSFSKEVTGSGRYLNAYLPRLPYGIVNIIPGETAPESASGWATDGQHLYYNGVLQKDTHRLTESLASQAADFVANTDDAFLSIQKDGDAYMLYISPTGYFYPEQEDVTVEINRKLIKDGCRLYDCLLGEEIEIKGNKAGFVLKPGEVKILRLY